MADSSVAITAGTGTPIRVLTGLGAANADQQVMTLADSAGNLLGTAGTPFPVAAPADVATTGTIGALNATVAIPTGGRAVTAIELTGTWAGTITFQGTSDPSGAAAVAANWYPVNAPTPTQAALGSTTTANGLFRINSGGYTAVRAIMTAYTSGTATAWVNSSAQSSLATLAEPVTIGAALPAGANTIGTVLLGANNQAVGTVALGPGTNLVGAIAVGGTTQSAFSTISAASTNATSVKAAAGSLYEVTVANPTATACYFKLYNLAAAPTVGTSVPVATYRVAATGSAGDTVSLQFGANGKRFTTGIAWAITAAAAATDATATVAGIQVHGTYV